jgi:hypothetical protein
MRRTVTFWNIRRQRSTKGSTTSPSLGMMTPTSTVGRSKSSTLLGMNPECSKSAPSPLSSLSTEVKKSKITTFFVFNFWVLNFFFFFCQLLSSEKYLQEVWPTVKSALKEYGISCELNLVSVYNVTGVLRKLP